jgi:hypothetical protein
LVEKRPEFRLGIIGGCLSHQRGIPLNALYHRRLAELLEAEPGIGLRVHVARDFDASMRTRLDRLVARSPVDGVLLHLRGAPLIASSRLVRRVWKDGAYRIQLNPAFRARRPAGDPAAGSAEADPSAFLDDMGDAYDESPDAQDLPPAGLRIVGVRVRNLNVAAAAVIGLDRLAARRQLGQFADFADACRARDLPFFVLGPTQTTYSWWTRRIVRRYEAAIGKRLAGSGVPFVLVGREEDLEGRPLIRADGTHLTPDGQRFIGELLHRGGIGGWMSAALGDRSG